MRWPCDREGCTFGDSGVCARAAEFTSPETECVDYLASKPVAALEVSGPTRETFPVWSGDALGPEFASRMDLATPPLRVLIAGPPSSGKTSLLTAQFLDLDRLPSTTLPAQFAGSYTLYGYDRLCDTAFRWKEGGGTAMPHTGRGSGRDPAWLHLALKFPNTCRVRHLLLSDMPGELFTAWSGDADALPLSLQSSVDAYWLVLDASKAKEKVQRSAAQDLLRRIAQATPSRSVEVILTKVDQVMQISDSTSPEEVLAAVPELVRDLGHAWGRDNHLQFTPVASYFGENKRLGWRTLEPIRHLLQYQRDAAPIAHARRSRRYVDYVGA